MLLLLFSSQRVALQDPVWNRFWNTAKEQRLSCDHFRYGDVPLLGRVSETKPTQTEVDPEEWLAGQPLVVCGEEPPHRSSLLVLAHFCASVWWSRIPGESWSGRGGGSTGVRVKTKVTPSLCLSLVFSFCLSRPSLRLRSPRFHTLLFILSYHNFRCSS